MAQQSEADSIPYRLRRSDRARRLRLTVRPDGVEVVAPRHARERLIAAFVDQHAGWIRGKLAMLERQLALHPGAARLEDGATLALRGAPVRLEVVPSLAARARVSLGAALRVELPRRLAPGAHEAAIEAALTGYLKRLAHGDASDAIARYGPPHGLTPGVLRIRAQRTLWGSCTAQGDINLNWRLVLAPPAVLDYVVVHELCHLRHRHHQPPFWRLVGEVMPDYGDHRRWLKRNGHLLSLRAPAPHGAGVP